MGAWIGYRNGAVVASYSTPAEAERALQRREVQSVAPTPPRNYPGLLPAGTVTEHGTIECSTLTAYRMTDGSYVAFERVHGRPAPATPLVQL